MVILYLDGGMVILYLDGGMVKGMWGEILIMAMFVMTQVLTDWLCQGYDDDLYDEKAPW